MMIRSKGIQLRRWLATILLFSMMLVFVGTFLLNESSFWVQLIRSGAEAGIVGGLVDWFAVVAIFRHPLGVPFPHTAVIRKSRDRFANGIDDFITENFSDGEIASEYVKDKRPGRHLSDWLTKAKNSKFVANVLLTSIPPLLKPERGPRIRHLLTKTVIEELKKQDILPTLGQILDHFYRHERHQEIIDVLVDLVKEYVEHNPGSIRETISKNSRRWIPRFLDRVLADNVEQSLLDELNQLADRSHPFRREIDTQIEKLIAELQQGQLNVETVKQVRQWWNAFVTSEQAGRLIGGLWDSIRIELFGSKGVDTAKIESKLAHGLVALGKHLAADAELQDEIDARLSNLAKSVSPAVVDVAAEYVREAVKDWPAEKVSDKLEGAVGKELQYIRFNGTVLGSVVGLLLFVVVEKAV